MDTMEIMETGLVKLNPHQVPLENGQSGKVLLARQCNKIKSVNDLSIGTLLSKLWVVIGLKHQNQPDDNELDYFVEYIKENLSEFTLEEIELAFKFYVSNKLDFKDPTFQNFNVIFLENVMQSYKRLRMTIPRHDQPLAIEEKTKPTKQEQDIIARNAAVKRFQEYKDHMDFWDFGGASFKYLVAKGLISLTNEQKAEIKKTAIAQLIREAQKEIGKKKVSEIAEVIEKILDGKDTDIQIRCKKIAMMDYFDELIEKGIELKEVLK